MYRVVVHRRAARYLQRLPHAQRGRLQSLLSDLALEPVRRPDVKPMVGEWKGYYRMRVGDVRIIFWLDTQEMTVYVDHIGPRGEVYK
jgi:mRNA interferase RelE/StbE